MNHLDVAIEEVERVENQLNAYDEIICHVRHTMEKMEEKNKLIEIANKNNQKLLAELEKVIVSLYLSVVLHPRSSIPRQGDAGGHKK